MTLSFEGDGVFALAQSSSAIAREPERNSSAPDCKAGCPRAERHRGSTALVGGRLCSCSLGLSAVSYTHLRAHETEADL
eukprot:3121524-Rhodomonas_salina.1